uniref:Uncharacterized protein n=1 Tax=Opuntia streptacantha TaxID=393608 RepID=A0A7C9CYG9_OPUST
MEEPIVKEFMQTDEFRYYVEDAEGILSYEEQLWRGRESLQLEKEAHAVTRAELDDYRKRVAALEALLGNVGMDPTETEVPMSDPHVDYVQSRCEVEAHGVIDTVLPHVLAAADV